MTKEFQNDKIDLERGSIWRDYDYDWEFPR